MRGVRELLYVYCVCPSVRPSVCLKPKFGRLKTKFDDDTGSAKRPRKTKFGPTFYVFYNSVRAYGQEYLRICSTPGSGSDDAGMTRLNHLYYRWHLSNYERLR